MKVDLHNLQKEYLRLVEQYRRDRFFRDPMIAVNFLGDAVVSDPFPESAFEAPAFFFDRTIHNRSASYEDPRRGGIDVPIAWPFDCFWFLYQTPNGAFSDNLNAMYVQRSNIEAKIYFAVKPINRGPWVMMPSLVLPDDKFVFLADQPLVVREYAPEFIMCCRMLPAGHRDREQPRELQEINAGRARSRNVIRRPLPDFIVVRDKPRFGSTVELSLGSGSAKSPHDRRGHIRRLRSGRIINVRPCAIHGGADRPQSYRVAAQV